jgi:hypothetical protein
MAKSEIEHDWVYCGPNSVVTGDVYICLNCEVQCPEYRNRDGSLDIKSMREHVGDCGTGE